MQPLTFQPIGIVHNNITERHAMPGCGVNSTIHLLKKYQKALYRINQKKYLWVICYLHQAKKDTLRVKPRKAYHQLQITRGTGLARKDELRGKSERESGVYMQVNEHFERTFNKVDRFSRKSVGVFASHSPDRPNPISITKVKLIQRKGLILQVENLDVIDGTLVLDIKSGDH